MDTILSPAIVKALAAPALKQFARFARRRTTRFRLALSVARQARSVNIEVHWRTLYRWLSRKDVQDALSGGIATASASVTRELSHVLSGDSDDRAENAHTLLYLILRTFLQQQDPSVATDIAREWQSEHTSAEARATRDVVDEARTSILERFDASSAFFDKLRSFHPWRRQEAIEIRDSWPQIETVVDSIYRAQSRAEILAQWCREAPTWYADAPPQVVCWLGSLASDYGSYDVSANYLSDAVDRGAFPSAYWRARQALNVLDRDRDTGKEVLQAGATQHPLCDALLAYSRDDPDSAIDQLRSWVVDSPQNEAIQLGLLASLVMSKGDLNGAVSHALAAASIDHATGALVRAAELLLTRGKYGQATNRLADAETASSLALRARNERRAWHGDSVSATLTTVRALALGENAARAWKLTQAAPNGEATQDEANDVRLRTEGARLAALIGRFDDAMSSADGINDPFLEWEIKALECAADGRPEDAVLAWNRAFDSARESLQQLAAAMGLAELGAGLPDLGDLEDDYPDNVREIRAVHRAMSNTEDRVGALRAEASENPLLTLKLADVHRDNGDDRMAGDVLKAGAERWNDARMMLMAARSYFADDSLVDSKDAIHSALALGGGNWAGESEARELLFEVHEAAGEWDKSTEQARALVALDHHNSNARWALVHCLVRQGELEAARSALTPDGEAVSPRNEHDALTWIALESRYDDSPSFVSRALQVVERWPDDERLVGVYIAQIYSWLQRTGTSPSVETVTLFREVVDDFVERFPNSTYFRVIPISIDDPLGSITDELRRWHDDDAVRERERIHVEVREGRLPLGMLSDAYGRGYAEASLLRAAGFAVAHDQSLDGRDEASLAFDSTVVIDSTAAHTLTLLDEGTRSLLTTLFGQLHTSYSAFRDAIEAQESLALKSTMYMGFDPDLERPDVTNIDEQQAEELAQRAQSLVEILRGSVRRPWPKLRTFTALPDDATWLAPIDMAATSEMPFWSDDLVLRRLASSVGASAFGTVDVVRHLARVGRIDGRLHNVIEGILVRHYYADLGFEEAALRFAGSVDGWRPRGAAFSLTRPAAWADPEKVVRFGMFAIDQCVDRSLEDVEGWMLALALGLSRVGRSGSAIASNMQLLLRICLGRPWMRADRLPTVLRALRQAGAEMTVDDPLAPALAEMYGAIAREHGHEIAAHQTMGLLGAADDDDKRTAARVILTYRDR